MKLSIEINMDNDAFKQNGDSELKAIMRTVMDNIYQGNPSGINNGNLYGAIIDTNGNRCGTYQITGK